MDQTDFYAKLSKATKCVETYNKKFLEKKPRYSSPSRHHHQSNEKRSRGEVRKDL